MAATHVRQVSAYVTPETHKIIRMAAKRDGMTVARWMRAAIRLKLKGEQNGKA
jgi:uncharacterized protein (DUF1778 family)